MLYFWGADNSMSTSLKDSQQEFAVWLKRLKQGLWDNLEGWGGEGDRREVPQGGDMCTYY